MRFSRHADMPPPNHSEPCEGLLVVPFDQIGNVGLDEPWRNGFPIERVVAAFTAVVAVWVRLLILGHANEL